MSKNYPDYFPEGCPPCEAEECEYQVYRLTNNPPIVTDKDFIPKAKGRTGETYSGLKAFTSCGLSVVLDPNDFMKIRGMASRLRKGKRGIATGRTYPYTGVVMKTGGRMPSHITWWVCKDYQPHKDFKVFYDGSVDIDESLKAI